MTGDPSLLALSAIRGQERAVARLSRILAGGLRSGAVLLWGPEGVGKRTTALALSRRILCAEPGDGTPCGRCLSCRTPLASHPDFHVLEPGETQSIGIDAVRELLRGTLESSLVSPCRIALLDEVHRLTPEASNSLLKSLEEPADNLLFFLLSPSPDRLLPTLLSRLLKVRFVALSDGDLVSLARELRPESSPEEIERAGVLSGGSVSRLLALVDSPLSDPLSRVATLLGGLGSRGRVDFAAVGESFPALAEKEGFDVFLDALERLLLSAERVAGGHPPLPEWAGSPLPALYAAEGPDFLRGSLHDKIGEMRRLSVHNINRGLALEQFLGWIGELFSPKGSGK